MKANRKKVTKTEVTEVNLDSTVRDIPIIGDVLPENQIESNNSGVTEVTVVTASNDAVCSGNPKKKAEVTGVTSSLSEAINPNEQPPLTYDTGSEMDNHKATIAVAYSQLGADIAAMHTDTVYKALAYYSGPQKTDSRIRWCLS